MNQTERKPLIKTDRWASPLGHNDDNRRIHVCPECRGQVVWCESKAGKFYLADVSSWVTESGRNRIVFNAGNPHFKSCGESKSRRDAAIAKSEFDDAFKQALLRGDHVKAQALLDEYETNKNKEEMK